VNRKEKPVNRKEKLVNRKEKLVNRKEKLVHRKEKSVNRTGKLVNMTGKLVNRTEKLVNRTGKLVNRTESLSDAVVFLVSRSVLIAGNFLRHWNVIIVVFFYISFLLIGALSRVVVLVFVGGLVSGLMIFCLCFLSLLVLVVVYVLCELDETNLLARPNPFPSLQIVSLFSLSFSLRGGKHSLHSFLLLIHMPLVLQHHFHFHYLLKEANK
jgi:ABC-type multidrug transport system fused ATPase/permease subunit